MQAKKYVHADGICIADTGNNCHTTEGNLSQGKDILTTHCQLWRLNLNEIKKVATTFHLNNSHAIQPILICAKESYCHSIQ